MAIEPAIAFCVRQHDEPALEVRVNFGVFAGRDVTPAEIDELARQLHHELEGLEVRRQTLEELYLALTAAEEEP